MADPGAAVILGGPTASGKSALALAVAREFGGTVINADSLQVYRELPILTAQPAAAAQAAFPHRLYGFLSASERCSAARWAALARAEIDAALAEGRLPIVVGGTGLYLRSLLHGLAPVPEIPADVRAAAKQRLAELGKTAFHAELARRDPAMAARIRPGDSQRMVRAWEVLEATGRSLADWQAQQDGPRPERRPALPDACPHARARAALRRLRCPLPRHGGAGRRWRRRPPCNPSIPACRPSRRSGCASCSPISAANARSKPPSVPPSRRPAAMPSAR